MQSLHCLPALHDHFSDPLILDLDSAPAADVIESRFLSCWGPVTALALRYQVNAFSFNDWRYFITNIKTVLLSTIKEMDGSWPDRHTLNVTLS